MQVIEELYRNADKGDSLNVAISDETIWKMAEKIKDTGNPVFTLDIYSGIENYEEVFDFLKASAAGKSGSVVIYKVHSDGGIGRGKYMFDGKDMYVLSAKSSWNDSGEPVMTEVSYTRLKEWRYSEKGWFCYELCEPEYPEVTEVINGCRMIRVNPMTEEMRELSKECVLDLGYQGNNLLCSNWDLNHMEDLDYNGIFEYLYQMNNQRKVDSESYPNGIPKDEFERLIMEYLPITAEQIREYAAFDEENQTYRWTKLGCLNYTASFFGTSVPEVTNIKKNQDGTLTLTVDAVCEMIIDEDAVITHELTVKFSEDGSFKYLGNRILNDGIMNIPDYQYRIDQATIDE